MKNSMILLCHRHLIIVLCPCSFIQQQREKRDDDIGILMYGKKVNARRTLVCAV